MNTLLENDLEGPDGTWITKHSECMCALRRVCKSIANELIDTGIFGNENCQTKLVEEAVDSSSEGDNGETTKEDNVSNLQAVRCFPTEDNIDSRDNVDNADMTHGKEDEMALVEWVDEDETLIHVASGLRYCPQWNYNFA